MSTAPVTPAPTPAPAPSVFPAWVLNWERLIKAHEKLIIVAILAFLGFHFYSRIIDAWDKHDSFRAQQAAQVVKVDDTKTKDDSAQLAALQKTVAAQSALIAQQIVERKQQTQKQQQNDETLPLPELGARLALLAQLTPAEVTSSQVPGSLVVSQTGALKITQQLETLPELQADNAALTSKIALEELEIAKQTTVIADLNTELTDEKKSHVADVKAEKVKTKHAFLRGLKIGLGIGFVAGFFGAHAISY